MLAQMFAMALRGRSSSNVVIQLIDGSAVDSQEPPNSSSSSFFMQTDGQAYATGNTADFTYFYRVGGTAAAYDARVTVTAGSFSAGSAATGTWVNLATDRQWAVTRTSGGSKSVTFTVEISLAGAGVAIDSATVTLSAEVV